MYQQLTYLSNSVFEVSVVNPNLNRDCHDLVQSHPKL